MPGSIAIPLPGIDLLAPVRKWLELLVVRFVNGGTSIITNRITNAGTAPKFIGWGVGATAAVVGDTALQTESLPTSTSRGAGGTESRVTTTLTSDTYQVVGTVTAASTLAITEAGLFDAATTGNMLIRSTFSAVNVVSGDSISFTFGLQFIPS